jgi:hypothetical protein
MSGLFLTDAEIDALCAPLKQPAAQVRFLRASGLTVTVKPNGRPVVVRSHAEAVLSGRPAAAASEPGPNPEVAPAQQPNRAALITLLQGGRPHGSNKKAQPA